MKLSELYKAALPADNRKFEVTRSDGSPSGHFITLIDPASDKAAQAVFMLSVAESDRMAAYEAANEELKADCEASGSFVAYNLGFAAACQDLRDAFAVEVVEGWDFDNKFSEKELVKTIEAFRSPFAMSLQRQIIAAFNRISAEHSKK